MSDAVDWESVKVKLAEKTPVQLLQHFAEILETIQVGDKDEMFGIPMTFHRRRSLRELIVAEILSRMDTKPPVSSDDGK